MEARDHREEVRKQETAFKEAPSKEPHVQRAQAFGQHVPPQFNVPLPAEHAVVAAHAVVALMPFGKRLATNCDGLVSTLKCWAHQQKFRLECTGAVVTYRISAFCILFFLTAI